MQKNVKLRHLYRVRMQALFCGVEWTVYRDNFPVSSGEASNLEKAFEQARFSCREFIRRDRKLDERRSRHA